MRSWSRTWLCSLTGFALLLVVTSVGLAQKTSTWSLTGSMGIARSWHTATLLPNGRVVVAGGAGLQIFDSALTTAELYEPSTGTWALTGKMNTGRFNHTATLLSNGRVLIAGGEPEAQQTTATAEVYDPATGIWSPTGSMSIGRAWHTATLLPNGKVLVAGGFVTAVSAWTSAPTATAEVYDPVTGIWSPTSSMSIGRSWHSATLLSNGKVLVVGGESKFVGSSTATAEVYDLSTGTWTPTGSMSVVRASHTATLLRSGGVLVVGGVSEEYRETRTSEVYTP